MPEQYLLVILFLSTHSIDYCTEYDYSPKWETYLVQNHY